MSSYEKPLDRSCFRIYENRTDTTFDPAKNEANRAKHGVSLADFAGFDLESTVLVDDRFD